ncbi:MAG: YihY/virulence factor BrkB family protein [Thermomicrobiales bacterium]
MSTRASHPTASHGGFDDLDTSRSKELVVQSAKDLAEDNGQQWAAAVTYYALLSSVPLLLVIISIATFFVGEQSATDRVTSALGNYAPQGGQVQQAVQGMISSRGSVGIISFFTLLWTGSRVFSALTQALNVVYLVDEGYSFVRRLVLSLVMTFTLGLGIVFAFGFSVILQTLRSEAGFLSFLPGVLFTVLAWLIQLALITGILYLIYHYVPKGDHDYRASLIGAVAAAVLFVIARPLFTFYIQEFGRQNKIYGPLAIVIIAMLWVWISVLITLYGGELASHTRAMLIDGQPASAVGKRHQDNTAL